MANTYSQIYVHIVFAVKNRQNLIKKEFREELHKYIAGIIKNNGQKLLAIYAMPDHIHIFIGISPDIKCSDLVRDIKANSSTFINESNFTRYKFTWQKGYGAFSYGHSQKDIVIKYILNQEKHHLKRNFREEYIGLLKKFNVEYDEKYLFEWI